MSARLGEKIEHHFDRHERKSRRYAKKLKLRAERRAARRDPETIPLYRKYSGYEY